MTRDAKLSADAARKVYDYAKQELNLSPADASRSLLFAAALVSALHVTNKEDFDLEIEVMIKSFLEWSHKLYLLKDEIVGNVH